MTQKFAGPLVGGPCAGQWCESPDAVMRVYRAITQPIQRGPMAAFTHTYTWHEFLFSTPDGLQVYGVFAHESLATRAEVVRELITHYRPIQPARR